MSIWDIIAQGGQDLLKSAVNKLQFRLSSDPVPAAWHDILARRVPLARALSAADRELLLRVAPHARRGSLWGVRLRLTDEIRVTIAATAALLLYRLPYPRFMKLVRVLVYPDTFVPRKAESRHDAMVLETDPARGCATG